MTDEEFKLDPPFVISHAEPVDTTGFGLFPTRPGTLEIKSPRTKWDYFKTSFPSWLQRIFPPRYNSRVFENISIENVRVNDEECSFQFVWKEDSK